MSRDNRDYTKRLNFGENTHSSYHKRRAHSESGSGLELVKAGFGILALVLGVAVRSCADTSGEGNEFKFGGVVVEDEENGDFKVRIVRIDMANGKAASTLVLGETVTVYDDFQDRTCDREDVGVVIDDVNGVLNAGDAVAITGSERDSVEKCSSKTPDIQDRLVYTEALRIPS